MELKKVKKPKDRLRKTSVMFMSNDPRLPTGFAKVVREISKRMVNDPMFNVSVIAENYSGPTIMNDGYKLLGVNRDKMFESVAHHLNNEKPDVLVILEDTFTMNNFNLHKINYGPVKLILYVPMDGDWIPFTGYEPLRKADKIVSMANFTRDVLHKEGFDSDVIYHGVDLEKFHPVTEEEKKALKKKIGFKEDDFLCFFYARNSVTGDTPVHFLKNNKPYFERFDYLINMIKEDKKSLYEVLTINEKTGMVIYSPINDHWEHKSEGGILEIYHENNNLPLRITKDHSVMILDGDFNIVEKLGSDLKEGDNLITFNKKLKWHNQNDDVFVPFMNEDGFEETKKIKITNKLCELFGFYVAEGCCGKHEFNFSFHQKEKDYHNFVIKEFSKLDKKINFTNTKRPNCKTQIIRFYSEKWSNFFSNTCGNYSWNKKIPEFIFSAGNDLQKSFIKGLLKGDGLRNKKRIGCQTVSLKLMSGLTYLLKMLGVPSTLTTKPPRAKHRRSYYVEFNPYDLFKKKELFYKHGEIKNNPQPRERLLDTSRLKSLWDIEKSSAKKINKYYNRLHKNRLDRKLLKESAECLLEKGDHGLITKEHINKIIRICDSDISILKIKNIKKVKNEIVYDVSVEGTETFFGGAYPILLHNSHRKRNQRTLESAAIASMKNPKIKTFAHIMNPHIKDLSLSDFMERILWHKYKRKFWKKDIFLLEDVADIKPGTTIPDEDVASMIKASDLIITGSCVSGDTEIVTENGVKKIKDINVGDLVLTHKGRYKQVTKLFKNPHNDKILNVKFDKHGGFDINITKNHKVLAIKRKKKSEYNKIEEHLDKKPEWIEIGKLKKGDFVCYPKIKEARQNNQEIKHPETEMMGFNGRYYTRQTKNGKPKLGDIGFPENIKIEDFLKISGYYLSEGCCSKGETIFCLNETSDNEIKKDLKTIFKKWGMNYRINTQTRHRQRYITTNKILCDLLVNYFGKGAKNKFIHQDLFKKKTDLLPLLKSCWLGDGWISDKEMAYTTTSKQLAHGIKKLLVRENILPSIKYNKKRDSYDLRICKKDDITKLMTLFNQKTKIINEKSINRYFQDEEFFYFSIRSIEEKEHEDSFVYNIEVKEDHSYVCNHITVKNSGEGFGLIMIEGGACGKPIVSCEYTTPIELLDDETRGIGKRGILANYKETDISSFNTEHAFVDIDDLANKIVDMAELYEKDKAKFNEYGIEGRKFAEKFCNWDVLVEEWKKVIREVM